MALHKYLVRRKIRCEMLVISVLMYSENQTACVGEMSLGNGCQVAAVNYSCFMQVLDKKISCCELQETVTCAKTCRERDLLKVMRDIKHGMVL